MRFAHICGALYRRLNKPGYLQYNVLGVYFYTMQTNCFPIDSEALNLRGWSSEYVEYQRAQLRSGCQPVEVDSPCTVPHGIAAVKGKERSEAQAALRRSIASGALWVRFVPASGSASRMFAGMMEPRDERIDAQLRNDATNFPFWSDERRNRLIDLPESARPEQAIAWMLDPQEGWAHLPKGLIPFHRSMDGSQWNSFQEHMAEWDQLMGNSTIHFTVHERFQKKIESVLDAAGRGSFETSIQHLSTDTVAWDLEKAGLARHREGGLLFRPGGHGALLQNLSALQGEFICIRNIDNVVPASLMAERNEEQVILMGECARLTEERNALIVALKDGAVHAVDDACDWLLGFDEKAKQNATDTASCLKALDRPLRVAGMVKNSGEAGGGPFWVKQSNGWVSPSIVESVELPEDMKGKGTHFNPVDIICSVRKSDGIGSYKLDNFADKEMFFTAQKSWHGRSIRILERPGLWNGAMAHWLTRFIEVPNATFSPVKTVMDLLKPERQA